MTSQVEDETVTETERGVGRRREWEETGWRDRENERGGEG